MAYPATRNLVTRSGAGRRSGIDRAVRLVLPAVARRDRAAIAIGWLALAAAIGLLLAAPPTLASFGLGIAATVGLSRDPRLGPLPAAALALIAIPYGRAAENGLAMVAGVPIRYHDGVVLAAAVLSLPALRRVSLAGPAAKVVVAWVAIGVGALMLGLASDNAIRDIVRDSRWWFLYATALLVIWGAVPRARLLRGVLAGATLFAVVMLILALGPVANGALKDRALTYDWGQMRLQFANAAFVLIALAWVVHRFLRRPSPLLGAWFVLLAAAIVMSLTRMSMLVALGVVGLSVLLFLVGRRTSGPSLRTATVRTVVLGGLVAMAVAVGIGAILLGSRWPVPADAGAAGNPVRVPLDRVVFDDDGSDVEAINEPNLGRLATYRSALEVIARQPVVGEGLGTLVPINFTLGGSRPATPGFQPGVDDAYLTVALKAGVVGVVGFAAMILLPLWAIVRNRRTRWLAAGWLGIVALTLPQAFASSGYGPFALGLLIGAAATIPPPVRRRPAAR